MNAGTVDIESRNGLGSLVLNSIIYNNIVLTMNIIQVTNQSTLSNFLAMNTNAKIFSINEFPVWFWDTKINFPKSNSHTFYIVNKFLEPIFKSVDRDGVIIQLEFFHPNISSQKIFYSYEDMLKNISEAVYNEL